MGGLSSHGRWHYAVHTMPNSGKTLDRQSFLAGVRSVVVKIGTNALTAANGQLDTELIGHFADQIAQLHQRGIMTTLVSSGAIGAGITELKLPGRPKELPMLQATAAVGQSILINHFAAAFRAHGLAVGQVLITRSDFEDRQRYLNLRNCVAALHENRAVPVFNENDTVAVDEIRFGDNDLIAAQVTNLLGADLLVLLSVVDGLLDESGKTVPVIQDMATTGALVRDTKSSRGTGGMGSKLMAAGTVGTAGEPVLIANGKARNILLKLLAGEAVGTLVVPGPRRMNSRRRWIALTAKTKGELVVDAGAAKALTGNKSLLARGVTAVRGEFKRGDAVAVLDPAGEIVARGLVNYARADMEIIMGHKSGEIAQLLHTTNPEPEAIHKNNMVLAE
jgi:glutamate 5-kinase